MTDSIIDNDKSVKDTKTKNIRKKSDNKNSSSSSKRTVTKKTESNKKKALNSVSTKKENQKQEEQVLDFLDDFLGETKEQENKYVYKSLKKESEDAKDLLLNQQNDAYFVDLINKNIQKPEILEALLSILRTCRYDAKLPDITDENYQKSYEEFKSNFCANKSFFKKIVTRLRILLLRKEDIASLNAVNLAKDLLTLINNDFLVPLNIAYGLILVRKGLLQPFVGTVFFQKKQFEELEEVPMIIKNERGASFSLVGASKHVFDGDIVEGFLDFDEKIVYYQKIIKPHNTVLGRVSQHASGLFLIPDDSRFEERTFYFDCTDTTSLPKLGEIVICNIIKRSKEGTYIVKPLEVLGDFSKLDVQIKSAIIKHAVPHEWNEQVNKQLEKIKDEVLDKDKQGRVDVRDLPLVTIDGEDARDFDDAVYCKKEGTNFRLYVAIADVSFYVNHGSALDNEALKRGNSVYFPNYVIPMLPEKLSNGLCSLNPHVDRLCMVCEMVISSSGKIDDYKFYPALMNSHARLTYTEVWDLLDAKKISNEEIKPLEKDINNLYDLYKVLKKAREKRGAVEFESKEVRFIFNDELNISDIVPVVRNDAHMLIEECMIAANVCAARFVQDNKGCTLYRVHQEPSELKVKAFRDYLSSLGLQLGGGDNPSSSDYAKLARDVKDTPNADAIYTMLLRSMSLAQYSPTNEGHFGLALSNYAHFTSPIRRYPDLQLHREIKYLLGKTKQQDEKLMKKYNSFCYRDDELDYIADIVNTTERRANEVTREVDIVLKAKFMEQFINRVFDGIITNVTDFGMFVTIDRYSIDGFVYIGNISKDFFVLSNNCLIGSNSRKVYRIGDKVKVKVLSVEIGAGKVNLSIASNKEATKENKLAEYIETKSSDKNSISNSNVNTKVRETFERLELLEGNSTQKGFELVDKKNIQSIIDKNISKLNKNKSTNKTKNKSKNKDKKKKK
jgi:ribonuclease R